jgi:phosphoribosylcarboxyaminoimidazole (NCAIR) mutase
VAEQAAVWPEQIVEAETVASGNGFTVMVEGAEKAASQPNVPVAETLKAVVSVKLPGAYVEAVSFDTSVHVVAPFTRFCQVYV